LGYGDKLKLTFKLTKVGQCGVEVRILPESVVTPWRNGRRAVLSRAVSRGRTKTETISQTQEAELAIS
jgi:hypothetical protein